MSAPKLHVSLCVDGECLATLNVDRAPRVGELVNDHINDHIEHRLYLVLTAMWHYNQGSVGEPWLELGCRIIMGTAPAPQQERR